MDSRFPSVVAAIVALAESKRAQEEKDERRQGVYDEALARYESQVRARNDERRTLRALFRDASRLQHANRLRDYIATAKTAHFRRANSRPRKGCGSSGPTRRPTGSIRWCGATIRPWIR